MLQVGQTIDRYQVESVIGTGGTAVVYLVHHTSLGTKHALKVLTVTSDVIRERMLQEGRVQATLVHPNVVAVTDVLEVDGQPGLLMEFIEGPSLQKAMREYKLPLEAAEVLFLGLLNGVKAAHDMGFIHRDIKPANVLLKQTDSGFVPKVTDFGLAKILRDEGEDTGRGKTRAGVAMGTPAYMASEQIRDAANVDRRADIFSLGCILYELVCGQRAFPGDDAIRIYNSIMSNDFQPPRELKPELPDRLVNAIEGCLVLDRNARIPDCDTLLAVMSGETTFEVPEAEPEFEEDPPTIETARPANPHAPEMQVALAAEKSLGEDDPTSVGDGTDPGRVVAKLEKFKRNVDDTILHDKAQPDVDPLYGPLGNSIVPVGEPDMDTIVQDEVPPPPEIVKVEQKGELGVMGWVMIGLFAMVVIGFAGGGIALSWLADQNRIETPSVAIATDPVVDENAGSEASGGNDAAGNTHAATEIDDNAVTDGATDVDTDDVTDTDEVVADAGTADPTESGSEDGGSASTSPKSGQDGATRSQPPAHVPTTDPTPDVGDSTPPPPKVGPVTAKILSKPPTASLRIDGNDEGRTPAKLTLMPGRHSVEVTSAGSTGTFDVRVTQGGGNKWCYAFEEQKMYEGSCP